MRAPRATLAVFVLALASCTKLPVASAAPSAEAPAREPSPRRIDTTPVAVRFVTATAATTCTTAIEAKGTILVKDGTHAIGAIAKSRVSLAVTPTSELGLQLREVHLRIDIDGKPITQFDIDAQGMETRTGDSVKTQRVADDAGAKRAVDLLLGAPRLFLTLDERAQVTKRRTDVPPAFAQLADLVDASPSWLLTMPVLPGEAKVGECWTGLRPLAVSSTVKPTPEVELRFCLVEVDDTHAVIMASGSTQGRYSIVQGSDGELRWSLDGEAKVTRDGGRLVTSRLHGTMDSRGHAEVAASSMTFEVKSECDRG